VSRTILFVDANSRNKKGKRAHEDTEGMLGRKEDVLKMLDKAKVRGPECSTACIMLGLLGEWGGTSFLAD
jgi:hypothetical protein